MNKFFKKIKKEYSSAFKFLRETKKYTYIIIYIFSFFALLGFFIPMPEEVALKIIEYFKELIEYTQGFGFIEMFAFLFKNNVLASFFGLVFGAFFGVFSIFNSMLNGFVVGFASSLSVAQSGISSLWRLIPHGIFELPALFISLGLGLRLGFFIFTKDKIKEFNKRLKGSLKVFLYVVVPLLFIAAIIESLLIVLGN